MTDAGRNRIRDVFNQADRTLHSPWLIGAVALVALMAIAAAGLVASSVQHVSATGGGSAAAQFPPTLPSPAGDEAPPDLRAELEKQLHSARYAFNRPESLRFREAATIELVLVPEELGVDPSILVTPDLPGARRQAVGSYALRMEATLSAPDFEVAPVGPQERTVLGSRETRWSWTIRPIAFGPDKPVTLEVFALLERDGRTFPPISVRTFHETFLIEVDWWDRTVTMAKDIDAFHASLAGIGIGGTITAVGLWFWGRRRQVEAKGEEDTPPEGGSNTAKPVRVFISYRHVDTRVLKDIRTSLGWLENSSRITVFDDREILAGDDWDRVIRKALCDADIIILVVTADFMASPYCTHVELQQALERRAREGTRIIPIIAEHCDRQSLPIADIAALPKDDENNLKPLNKWRGNRDVALSQIAQHVRRNVERFTAGPVAQISAAKSSIGNEHRPTLVVRAAYFILCLIILSSVAIAVSGFYSLPAAKEDARISAEDARKRALAVLAKLAEIEKTQQVIQADEKALSDTQAQLDAAAQSGNAAQQAALETTKDEQTAKFNQDKSTLAQLQVGLKDIVRGQANVRAYLAKERVYAKLAEIEKTQQVIQADEKALSDTQAQLDAAAQSGNAAQQAALETTKDEQTAKLNQDKGVLAAQENELREMTRNLANEIYNSSPSGFSFPRPATSPRRATLPAT